MNIKTEIITTLAAIVILCSCSSSKVATDTTMTEQTDAAFQRTCQFDLSISRLVASTDSNWTHIVIFDTSKPVVQGTILPPVKAYIERGSKTEMTIADTVTAEKIDTTKVQVAKRVEVQHSVKTKNESVVTQWRRLIAAIAVVILLLLLWNSKKQN